MALFPKALVFGTTSVALSRNLTLKTARSIQAPGVGASAAAGAVCGFGISIGAVFEDGAPGLSVGAVCGAVRPGAGDGSAASATRVSAASVTAEPAAAVQPEPATVQPQIAELRDLLAQLDPKWQQSPDAEILECHVMAEAEKRGRKFDKVFPLRNFISELIVEAKAEIKRAEAASRDDGAE